MRFLGLIAGSAALLAAGLVHAQDYPTKPINFVVAAGPGGPSDTIARIVADGLKTRLPQPVVVENRPGQGGQLATVLVGGAAPDGYTFLVTTGGLASLPVAGQDFKLDPATDFEPVVQMTSAARVLLARADAPFNDAASFIAYAKANPGKINFGDMGGTNTLDMALLASRAGISVASIPYAGSAAQVQPAIAAGEIDIALDVYSSARNFLEQGRTKALAVGTAGRHAKLPNVASISDAIPGYEASSAWYAIVAPKGTPANVIEKMNTEIRAILAQPEVLEKVAGLGLDVTTGTPAELGALIRKDMVMWKEAAEAAKVGK